MTLPVREREAALSCQSQHRWGWADGSAFSGAAPWFSLAEKVIGRTARKKQQTE